MFRLICIPILLLMVGCTFESSKCTKEDILQLTDAGYSMNEISEICDRNEIHDEEDPTAHITATVEKTTPASKDKPIEIEPDSVSTNESRGSDLEGKANKLYVQASNQVQKIRSGAGSYTIAFELHQSALKKIERITSDYDVSNLAVAVISDQMKIAGLTLSELEQIEGTLQSLAEAERDPLACALLIAQSIDDSSKGYILRKIASKYAESRQYEKAAQLYIQAGEHSDHSNYIYSELSDSARMYVKAGQQEKAAQMFSQAIQATSRLKLADERADALVKIAVKYADVGQPGKAVKLLTQAYETTTAIMEENMKAHVMALIAFTLSEVGQKEKESRVLSQALELARTANSSYVLYEIAGKYRDAGQQQKADRIHSLAIEVALSESKTIKNARSKQMLLINIAEMYIKAGREDEAPQILTQAYESALQIKPAWVRVDALAEIAEKYAEAGEQEQANRTFSLAVKSAASLEKLYWRAVTLSSIAGKFAKTGQHQEAKKILEQAIQVAETLEDAGSRSRPLALNIIAGEYAEIGKFEKALQIARAINDDNKKAMVLAEIAGKYAESGQLSKALEIAKTIDDVYRLPLILSQISGKFYETGRYLSDAESAILHDIIKKIKPMKLPWEFAE